MVNADILTWLDQHGGREERDLLEDDKGWYVYMGNGFGGLEKVYLPTWLQPQKKE